MGLAEIQARMLGKWGKRNNVDFDDEKPAWISIPGRNMRLLRKGELSILKS